MATMEYTSRSLRKQYGAALRALLASAEGRIEAIAALLDELPCEQRILAVRSLSGRSQARLWELCEGRALSRADLVPDGLPDGFVVRHFGRNSLPAFTLFEKRFTIADEGEGAGTELWGFNFQKLQGITGPGYFVAYEDSETGSVAIDYRRVPPHAPAGCPAVQSNDVGLSKLVYKDMIDHMRKVSEGVSIGRVFKHGKWQSNYFVLCRQATDLDLP